MHFSEEIRNYEVMTALPSKDIKTSREYFALSVLKYSFPDQFSNLKKGEAPDLQDMEGSLGVEVTWGGSERDELISGESYKYSHAKTEKDRERCLRIIRQNGGDRDEFSISYPVETSDGDKSNVINAFLRKLKKTEGYRECFKHLGLAILIDIPLFFFTDSKWGDWLSECNDGKYDFVALLHWSGVDIYDFIRKEYVSFRISREDMNLLKKLGRMATEGIIHDDDPVWK